MPQNEEIVMVGDFNFPDVKWNSMTISAPENTTNKLHLMANNYIDMFLAKGLCPFVRDGTVTRRRLVDGVLQESLLDQVLTSNSNLVGGVEILSPLGKSDHVTILIDLKIKNNIDYLKTKKEMWSKFDQQQINNSEKQLY